MLKEQLANGVPACEIKSRVLIAIVDIGGNARLWEAEARPRKIHKSLR